MNPLIIVAVLLLLVKKKNKPDTSVIIHDWSNSGYPQPAKALKYNEFINSQYFNSYSSYIDYVEQNGGWLQGKEIKNFTLNGTSRKNLLIA